MMMNSRNHTEQAMRFAERRTREDEAPRLHDEVPSLVSLKLNVEDRSGVIAGTKYTRRVVVDRAPALFVVPCGDPRCQSEGHDLTRQVMSALRARARSFQGEDGCNGSVGQGECLRVLKFEAVAEYGP
jgi:hypothetical protein